MKRKRSHKILSVLLCALMAASASVALPTVIENGSLQANAYDDYAYDDYDDYDYEEEYWDEEGEEDEDDEDDELRFRAGDVFSSGDFTCYVYTNPYCDYCLRIVSYNGSSANVEVPDQIFGMNVKAIGSEAFSGCTRIKSVNLPDSIQEIGSDAFKGCTALESFVVPDDVTYIGDYAFFGCTNLRMMVCYSYPYDEYGSYYISDNAFNGCNNLVIYGEYTDPRSYIEEYADSHNIPFVAHVKVEQKTVAPNIMFLGDQIKYRFKGKGGTGIYSYKCSITDPDGTSVFEGENETGDFDFTPKKAGAYSISAVATDSNGISSSAISSSLEIRNVKNNSTISETSINKGESVTINGSVTAIPQKYQYAYVVQDPNGKWTVLQNYSSASSVKFTPSLIGIYKIQVKAKNSTGTVFIKELALKVNAAFTNDSTISKTTIAKGQSVVLKGAASYGVAPYQYAYVVQAPNGKWTVLKGYSTAASYTWTPASAGKYTVQIKAKDGHDEVKVNSFTLNVVSGLTSTSTVSASSVKKGQSVTFNASAVGGTAPYQYAYVVQAPSGKWTVLKGYSTDASHKWAPASVGKYTLQIKVKDAKGTVSVSSFTLNVAGSELTNASVVSASSVKKGQSVTFTGNATGGTAPYQYAYVVKAPNGKWTVLKSYSTAASHKWAPASVGTYTLQIKVKDSKDTVKVKEFTLAVKA